VSKSIRIVIAALGGEGGGVLGKWIADMAAREGYLSQSTSVPGVAQRTGATIYYVELFPRAEAEAAGRMPVLSMFPTPGDVDIVICSEIVEAGRMIQRGFVTPERTTLISSTHRTYGISEKQAMGNGVADKQAIIYVAKMRAKKFIGFDMLDVAREFDTVINAALFGAVAGAGVLPFARDSFEETIRLAEIAVTSNLDTFASSFDLASEGERGAVQFADPAPPTAFQLPAGTTVEGKAILAQVRSFPAECQETLYQGVKRLVHYQDYRYAHEYLERVRSVHGLAPDEPSDLTNEVARFLALWMAYEDLPRVAQIKISAARFERFREEVNADAEQEVGMVEFLHPRVEEFCGAMPVGMGRYMQQSRMFSGLLGLFARPRTVRTDGVFGFLTFYAIAGLRRFRRSSLAYQLETGRMENWLRAVKDAAGRDSALALELARCGRLIKGYGSTRERGNHSLQTILDICGRLDGHSAETVARLREAALADDQGENLSQLESQLQA
jgi:indolepyruvate ferredoxin oxidoreductase beta subunit